MSYAQDRLVPRYGSNEHYNSTPMLDTGLAAVNQYKSRFTISQNATYDPYHPRSEQRYMHLADYHRNYLEGGVIDVGSRSSELLERLTGIKANLVDKHNQGRRA